MLGVVDGALIEFVGRSANLAADWLVKKGSEELCPMDWVLLPPPPLDAILRNDACRQDEATGIGLLVV